VARSGTGSIKITPEKSSLAPGDSTEIELELIDECDEYILKNREIILEPYIDPETGEKLCDGPSGGTVNPMRVTTDDNGKATVTFVAGSEGGLGIINGAYPLKQPHGWRDAMIGQASINLTGSMVQVDVVFVHNSSSSMNATTMDGEITTKSSGDSYFKVVADLKFVYENKNPNNMGEDKLIVITDDPDAGIVHSLVCQGSYQEGGTTRIEKSDKDGLFASYFSQSSISSHGRRSLIEPWLNASFTLDAFSIVQLSGSISRTGWSHEKISDFPDGGPVKFDDTFSVMNAMFTALDNDARFTTHGPPFQVGCDQSETLNEGGASATIPKRTGCLMAKPFLPAVTRS